METKTLIARRDNKNIVLLESNKVSYEEFLKSIDKEKRDKEGDPQNITFIKWGWRASTECLNKISKSSSQNSLTFAKRLTVNAFNRTPALAYA